MAIADTVPSLKKMMADAQQLLGLVPIFHRAARDHRSYSLPRLRM